MVRFISASFVGNCSFLDDSVVPSCVFGLIEYWMWFHKSIYLLLFKTLGFSNTMITHSHNKSQTFRTTTDKYSITGIYIMSADNMKSLLKLFESAEPKPVTKGHFADKKYTDKGLPKPYPKLKDTATGKTRSHPADKSVKEGIDQNDEVIPGFKNSRPIRVIVNGRGIDTTVGELGKIYSPEVLSQVARDIPPIHAGRTSILVHLLQQYDTIMGSPDLDEGIDQNDEGWPHSKPAEPNVLVIVSNALDAAIRSIQQELGNKSGDVAAHFFDGEEGETIMEILKDYVQQEIAMSDDLTENAGAYNQQAHELAQQALSAAVRYIQDELNVSEEDEEIAYEFFSDNYTDQILDMFVEFIEHQVDAQHNGDAPPYDEEELDENFGGGMRDRPGSDTKSFDLAECKAFLAKRVLKG